MIWWYMRDSRQNEIEIASFSLGTSKNGIRMYHHPVGMGRSATAWRVNDMADYLSRMVSCLAEKLHISLSRLAPQISCDGPWGSSLIHDFSASQIRSFHHFRCMLTYIRFSIKKNGCSLQGWKMTTRIKYVLMYDSRRRGVQIRHSYVIHKQKFGQLTQISTFGCNKNSRHNKSG